MVFSELYDVRNTFFDDNFSVFRHIETVLSVIEEGVNTLRSMYRPSY